MTFSTPLISYPPSIAVLDPGSVPEGPAISFAGIGADAAGTVQDPGLDGNALAADPVTLSIALGMGLGAALGALFITKRLSTEAPRPVTANAARAQRTEAPAAYWQRRHDQILTALNHAAGRSGDPEQAQAIRDLLVQAQVYNGHVTELPPDVRPAPITAQDVREHWADKDLSPALAGLVDALPTQARSYGDFDAEIAALRAQRDALLRQLAATHPIGRNPCDPEDPGRSGEDPGQDETKIARLVHDGRVPPKLGILRGQLVNRYARLADKYAAGTLITREVGYFRKSLDAYNAQVQALATDPAHKIFMRLDAAKLANLVRAERGGGGSGDIQGLNHWIETGRRQPQRRPADDTCD